MIPRQWAYSVAYCLLSARVPGFMGGSRGGQGSICHCALALPPQLPPVVNWIIWRCPNLYSTTDVDLTNFWRTDDCILYRKSPYLDETDKGTKTNKFCQNAAYFLVLFDAKPWNRGIFSGEPLHRAMPSSCRENALSTIGLHIWCTFGLIALRLRCKPVTRPACIR